MSTEGSCLHPIPVSRCTSPLLRTMTSITHLLSPLPLTKHSLVLPQQQYPPPPQSSTLPESMDAIPQQQQQQPQHQPQASSPNASINNDGVTGSAESDGADTNTDGRKGYGKRELSTSKRAAQNRAAQVCGFCSLCLYVTDSFRLPASIPSTKRRLYQET